MWLQLSYQEWRNMSFLSECHSAIVFSTLQIDCGGGEETSFLWSNERWFATMFQSKQTSHVTSNSNKTAPYSRTRYTTMENINERVVSQCWTKPAYFLDYGWFALSRNANSRNNGFCNAKRSAYGREER
jgi:hypothetical protein